MPIHFHLSTWNSTHPPPFQTFWCSMHDAKDTLATSKENMRKKAKSRRVCIKKTSVILMTYKVNIKSTVLSVTIIIVLWGFLFFFFFFLYFGIYFEMSTSFNCIFVASNQDVFLMCNSFYVHNSNNISLWLLFTFLNIYILFVHIVQVMITVLVMMMMMMLQWLM